MNTITTEALTKSFNATEVLRDVSLSISQGEIFGLLGPNGAGKTTTVECIGGMISQDTGTVQVLGIDPQAEPQRVRRRLGYQMQSSTLPADLRVGEALRMFAAFYSDPVEPSELLETVGLSTVSKRAFGVLSGGQKQRLSIALALIGRPQVVILDEITTGLDPEGRHDVWQLIERIRSNGVTILLVSHSLEEVQRLCDRICVIVDGQAVYTGTCQQLISQSTSMRTNGSSVPSLEEAYLALTANHRQQE